MKSFHIPFSSLHALQQHHELQIRLLALDYNTVHIQLVGVEYPLAKGEISHRPRLGT